MLTNTLDPFKQLAVQHPVVDPGPPPAGPFTARWGLLNERQFHLSAADERTLSLIEAPRIQGQRQGTGLATELEFAKEPVAKLDVRELFRALSTLREEPIIVFPQTVEPIAAERDALPFLMVVRQFIETEQLSAARKMFESAPVYILSDPLVARLRSVLAPPIVKRVQKHDVDRSVEYEWLRTEGHKYRGRWVALVDNQLLAVASSLRDLREQLRTIPLTRPPLIHRLE